MLLIYPPFTKATEPPAGIARLAGALAASGGRADVLDLNLDAQLHLLGLDLPAPDTWTRRAVLQRDRNLAAIRDPRTYGNRDRYAAAVRGLNQLLAAAGRMSGRRIGLADYGDPQWSPLRSADLLRQAAEPDAHPLGGYFRERLARSIAARRPERIGLSVNFLNQALSAFALLGIIRRDYPDVPVAVGGGLVTSWLGRPGWTHPFGELTTDWIAGAGEAPLLRLAGLSEPLPALPVPAYDGFPIDAYLAPGFILEFGFSEGCFWNRCAFCSERTEGRPYAGWPAGAAAAALRGLTAHHRPVLIHLLDNALSPAALRALIADPPGAPWYGFARFTPELADPEFCRGLKRSGCRLLQLGLESGDPAVLERMQKGIDLQAAGRTLHRLHDAGIGTYVYLLFGTPWEAEPEARRTMDFVAGHAPAIGFLNVSVFNLPRGCDEAAGLETRPFSDADLSLYEDFRHPLGWDRLAVRRFLDREFTRHPLIAPILRPTPPEFTSNHAPFFVPDGWADGAGRPHPRREP
jgi:hypothetical protein